MYPLSSVSVNKKLTILSSIANPIMMKFYGAGGEGGMPGGAPGGFPGAGGPAPGQGGDDGPTVEEVD